MNRSTLTELLDRWIGLESHAAALKVAEELRQSPNPKARAEAEAIHRHSRGLMAATARVSELLNGTK